MQNEQRNSETEEIKRKIITLFNLLIAKEDIGNVSKLKRYVWYLFMSIIIFFATIFLIIKSIVLLQFTSIPSLFYSLKMVDDIIKEYLEI